MKNDLQETTNQRVVAFLNRNEVDYLDKVGKDALFSTGFKVSRTKLIAWLVDFIQKLKRNPSELEVLGDGEQEKNYFTVDECIDGMCYVISNSSAQCDIYNLGADTTTKVSEIARIVIQEMGLNGSGIRYTGGQRGWPGDQPKVYLDTKKVINMGWKPKHTSTEAIHIATRALLDDKRQGATNG